MNFTSGLQLGWAEALTGFWNCLSKDRLEHDSIECLKDEAEEKGSGQLLLDNETAWQYSIHKNQNQNMNKNELT